MILKRIRNKNKIFKNIKISSLRSTRIFQFIDEFNSYRNFINNPFYNIQTFL